MAGLIAQWIAALLGVWLMAAPAALGYTDAAATLNHALGPVITTFAVVAVWEVTRPLRWVNVALALPVAALLPFFDTSPAAVLNNSAAALVIVGCSLIRGSINTSFGGGWSVLWQHDPYHLAPANHHRSNRSDAERHD